MGDISYTYYEDDNLITYIGDGDITGAEFMQSIIDCHNDYTIRPGNASLLDFRNARMVMSQDEVFAYRTFFIKFQDQQENCRWHICALDQETVNFAKWIHRHLDNDFNITITVHETESAIKRIVEKFLKRMSA